MILVDANVLIYATTECPQQHRALDWLDKKDKRRYSNCAALGGVTCLLVRIVTDFRLYPGPLSAEQACDQIERWLERPNIWTPLPSNRHLTFLRPALEAIGNKSRLTPDAHPGGARHGTWAHALFGGSGFFSVSWIEVDEPHLDRLSFRR